ncbi:MAG: MarR family transcriptional regulator [Telmatospirillum sp.]|nr:MarR family transcriptional regulator [Telmatospirillum sp.]
MDEVDLTLNEFLCFAIYTAEHAFTRLYKPLLDRLGLTYPQYLVIVALWEEDGASVGRIGEKLFLESNTVTPLLKRLETAGFVRRSRNPADERQVRIQLTDRGWALRKEVADVPGCVIQATGRDLPDLKRLRDEICALRDAIAAFNISTAGRRTETAS